MKMSIISAKTDILDWLTKIRICIAQTGKDNFFVNVGKSPGKNLHHIYFKRVKAAFYQNSPNGKLRTYSLINSPNGKLRTYSLIKGDFSADKYLYLVRNIKHRVSLSKFRLSNHRLLIEVGRHLKLPKLERVCPSCTPSIVEDEIHSLIKCSLYREENIT